MALALAGCSALAQGTPQGSPIAVQGRPLALDPGDPGRERVGELTWAGGLELTASGTSSFGGLSGIDVEDDGRFLSQTDTGALIRGRLRLDPAGRLAGVDDATLQLLTDEKGAPFGYKMQADAEDVTITPGGYAISFEGDHRVMRYRAGTRGGVRQTVSPDLARRPKNAGLEALAWKDGRFYEGAEDGEIWRCDGEPGGACTSVMRTSPFPGFKLTGLDAAGRGFVAVYRAVDVFEGWRAVVAWLEPAGADGTGPWRARRLAVLGRPLTRDNMEGVAAVPHPDGRGFRLYLVSDDNFYSFQRTLLLAFDWPGPPPLPPAAATR